MASAAKAQALFVPLKAAFDENNHVEFQALLTKLKILSTSFTHLAATSGPTEEQVQQFLLTRQFLEYAALASIKVKDLASFERQVAQAQTYYHLRCSSPHWMNAVSESENQYLILGLNLLKLLALHKLAEFHTELEKIPLEQHSNKHIRHSLQLVEYLVEGSYSKVFRARQEVPSEYYTYFMDLLMVALREEMAQCLEKAHTRLLFDDIQTMLKAPDANELRDWIQKREGWIIVGDHVEFRHQNEHHNEVSSMKIATRALAYAKELERIV